MQKQHSNKVMQQQQQQSLDIWEVYFAFQPTDAPIDLFGGCARAPYVALDNSR